MPDLYFLIEFPIFREFDADDVEALAAVCEERSFEAGATVVKEGDPGDAMYIVKSGVLEVVKRLGAESRHINLINAGEFFGELALIDGTPRSADVRAKEASVAVRLPREAYLQLKKGKPATALRIADVLLKTLSFRVRRSTTRAIQSEAAPAQGVVIRPLTPRPVGEASGAKATPPLPLNKRGKKSDLRRPAKAKVVRPKPKKKVPKRK